MIKRVDLKDLEVGMFVDELDRPWIDTPFLDKLKIDSPKTIDELRDFYVRYVYIDTEKGKDSKRGRKARDLQEEMDRQILDLEKWTTVEPTESLIPFELEINHALDLRLRAHELLLGLMRDVWEERTLFLQPVRQMSMELVNSVIKNANALPFTTRLKPRESEDPVAMHSVNTAIVGILIGRFAGFGFHDLVEIGMGGLLHDLGKMKLDSHLAETHDVISLKDFTEYQRHVPLGTEIVEFSWDLPKRVREIVAYHHERYDGSGYPEKRKGEEIPELAQIVAVADVYDAITTDRSYEAPLTPYEAVQKMIGWRGASFNPVWVDKLVEALGLYPIGTLVQLSDGCVGFVKRINHAHLGYPVVVTLFDWKTGTSMEPRELDLLEIKETSPSDPLSIERVVSQTFWELDLETCLLQ
jgi:HD-GYP domain-containing protein (c-di-GMP phosphodiesterase class II)